jgi:hypothetical protein
MMTMTVAGGVISSTNASSVNMVSSSGSDLRLAAEFFANAAKGDALIASQALDTALKAVPDEMQRVAAQLRQVPELVVSWQEYVSKHWKTLCSPSGCYDALVQCSNDPSMGGTVKPSDSNWLYNHLVALLRASAGRNNDFGYGAFVSYFKSQQASASFQSALKRAACGLSGSAARIAEQWINKTLPQSTEPGRRGFQDWLSCRKALSPVVIAAFAYSLSIYIKRIPDASNISLSKLIDAHAYNLWNKLLTYQDFEPLPALVETACGAAVNRISARTVMADLAERAVQNAGTMPALAFDGGLVYWKSVTDSGKDHKRKELCGRARALRFEKSGRKFGVRKAAKKLFLVVDGTFNDDDIAVLTQSGWDRIFYPDEMEDLLQSIT